MDIITCLKDDHDIIRKFMQQLESAEDFASRKHIFSELFVAVRSHFRAEETALYARCLNLKSLETNELALDGYEDHHLLEDFVYKIKTAENEDLWNTRVKTFCQILELHLAAEESDFFPELKNYFSPIDLQKAAVTYLQTKKSEEIEAGQDFGLEKRTYLN